ncbi:MAG: hypothetical protein R3C03_11170 [Pirellulaceae bacterium]
MFATMIIDELKQNLTRSDAVMRRDWAARIVNEKIPLDSLLCLLHGDPKIAERFTWLIGDLLVAAPNLVRKILPFLFAVRDEMPFEGIWRTVAKCLCVLGVPSELEDEAIPQLLTWLENDRYPIACKHYASMALVNLEKEGRVDRKRLIRILKRQQTLSTPAHQKRMAQLHQKLTRT